MPAMRRKSEALMALAVALYDELARPGRQRPAHPRDPARRGSHLTVTHPNALITTRELIPRGIIPDFRRPDGIRLGMAPLTTRFVDVYDACAQMATLGALIDGIIR